MKIRSVILAILVAGLGAYAQTKGDDVSKLAGTYVTGHRFGGSSITLKENGTYSRRSSDCTQEYNERGTYTLASGIIHFATTEFTVNAHGETDKIDLLDPQKNAEVPGRPEEIDKTFEMTPVYWQTRIYLIEDSIKNFAHAINLGIEPRKELSSELWMGPHYLRSGDEKKTVSGIPVLPAGAASSLLRRPIIGRIIKIEGNKGERIATINKGRADGVATEVILLERYEEPSAWWKPTIVSIGLRTAKLKVSDNAKTGDTISSKYVSPYLFSANLYQ